jgi:hypothetical protein
MNRKLNHCYLKFIISRQHMNAPVKLRKYVPTDNLDESSIKRSKGGYIVASCFMCGKTNIRSNMWV